MYHMLNTANILELYGVRKEQTVFFDCILYYKTRFSYAVNNDTIIEMIAIMCEG